MLSDKIKGKKGITLIALVITIIIMLILVTVTINLTITGGLFDYARKSTIEFDAAKEKELIEQAKMLAMVANKDAVIKKTVLDKKLEEVIGKDNYKIKSTEEGINVTFEGSGRNYLIEYDNQVEPEYFYIYKCIDCSVERIQITEEIETNGYDITKKVDSNNYYGGYYSTYGGTETDIQSLTYVNNKAIDENGEIYNGTTIKNSNNVAFWSKKSAYTEPGNVLIPEDGKVYYLKEVPKTYLAVNILLDYYPNNYNILRFIHINSVIEHTYYNEKAIDVIGDEVIDTRTTLVNTGSYVSGTLGTVTVTPQSFDGVEGGFVLMKVDCFETIKPDMQFTVTPYWVTYDGIRVDGQSKTYNTGNDGNGRCTKDTFHEVIN